MKKLIVMLLVLGLVAAPVFAQNKKRNHKRKAMVTAPQSKVRIDKLERKMARAEKLDLAPMPLQALNKAYERYMDKVINKIVINEVEHQSKMEKSIIQKQSNIMLQLATAYMQLDEFDRCFHAVEYFAGNYQFNDQWVYISDFLEMTVPVLSTKFSKEQQAKYEAFVKQVRKDVKEYWERYRSSVANAGGMRLNYKPNNAGELIQYTEPSSPFKHLQKLP